MRARELLTLAPEKTVIPRIADGFDFLGQHIRQYHGQLLFKPAVKSIETVLRTAQAVMQGKKSAAAGPLTCQVHPIIRGCAMYHRHVVSSQVCPSVDHAIFQALWRWAKRCHPNKGAR